MGGGGGSVLGGRVEFVGRDDGTGLSAVSPVEASFVFLGGGGGVGSNNKCSGSPTKTAATKQPIAPKMAKLTGLGRFDNMRISIAA